MLGSHFSLAQLPYPGIDDMTRSSRDVRGMWMIQLQTVRGIKKLDAKTPLGPYLKQSLDNLDFLCGLALAQLDHRQGVSTTWENAGNAGGLRGITQAFIEEVHKAQAAWNQWLGVMGPKGPNDKGLPNAKKPPDTKAPPALGQYGGFGASAPETQTSVKSEPGILAQLATPPPEEKYWMKLGVAAGLLFLAYTIRREF